MSTIWRQGLPLTAPDRTLVDVLHTLQPEQVEMTFAQAVRCGLITEKQPRTAAYSPGRKRFVAALLPGTTTCSPCERVLQRG